MKQIASLTWKEWRESRPYLFIALGVFILLPFIGALEGLFQYSRRFEISSSPWVISFGGVLAIFVGVAATCRDFQGRLEEFWRSRPVGIVQWLITKYLVGLAIVLISCILPLALELLLSRHRDDQPILDIAFQAFSFSALYSLGFLSGALVRRTAHAAMLGLAAMLLLYFLPMISPPLGWLSIATVNEDWRTRSQFTIVPRHFAFAAGMSGLSLLCLLISLLVIDRDWRIASGPKMMYASVSSALLILLASAAFHLGTNLPILQEIDLPNGECAERIYSDGRRGFVITWKWSERADGTNAYHIDTFYHPLEITSAGVVLGNGSTISQDVAYYHLSSTMPPGHPEITYRLGDTPSKTPESFYLTLDVARLDTGTHWEAVRLWEFANTYNGGTVLYIWENRLYVIGQRLVTFDISDPLKPKMLSNTPFQFTSSSEMLAGDRPLFSLPAIPDLPPCVRLEVALKKIWTSAFDGQMLVVRIDRTFVAYRLKNLTEISAMFEKVDSYEPTMLENVFGGYYYDDIEPQNGLVFVNGSRQGSLRGRSGIFNARLAVFDTRSSHPLRPIAHFAAPGAEILSPLPDGRTLVAGTKLWLIGPPKSRN